MDEEVAPALEPDNHILPATVDGRDAFALEFVRHGLRWLRACQPLVENPDALEPPADEHRT
jgi:hypothetical protein